MSGKNISCTPWRALQSWALPLQSPSSPCLSFPHMLLFSKTLSAPSKFAFPCHPAPLSLHSFPRGACPFSQVPKDQRGEVLGTGVTCLLHRASAARAAGSSWGPSWAALTALAGAVSRGMLLARSDPIRMWLGGSFRDTTGDVPYYSPTPGPDLPCIYEQGNSPSCFHFPLYRTTVMIFTLLLHRSIFRIN